MPTTKHIYIPILTALYVLLTKVCYEIAQKALNNQTQGVKSPNEDLCYFGNYLLLYNVAMLFFLVVSYSRQI